MPEKGLVTRTERPPSDISEQLTQNFYDWEKRGRGWRVYDYPIELEPAFRLFFHQAKTQVEDDGRIPGFFETLLAGPKDVSPEIVPLPPELLEEMGPSAVEAHEHVELQVSLPKDLEVSPEIAEHFILQLCHASYPVSFELIGLPKQIILQIGCHEEDLRAVRQSLRAFYRDAAVKETRGGFLKSKWSPSAESLVVDFGLSQEFMLPLKTSKSFNLDPLIGIISALEDIREGELAVFQVLFQKTVYAWARNAARSVTDYEGGDFFTDAPHVLPLAIKKISKPLFAVLVRVAAQSENRDRSWQIARSLGTGLRTFANPTSNELFPLANDEYPDREHEEDFVNRLTRRSGMLLNSEELANLVHLPSISVRSEKLRQKSRKCKPAPDTVKGHETILGENECGSDTVSVTLSEVERIKHLYMIGASGTGKSTLLLSLILQDIEHGKGVGVLDPHGDLVDQILGAIPERRYKDVILFDPADSEFPIGFNILSAHSELEKNLLSSDLVAVFHRLSTSWGDQMNSVLGNAILAFLESEKGGTLADLRRFLVERTFREDFLRTVQDQEIVYYWQKEFPLLQGRPQAPILTRLDAFLRPKLVRHMVSQQENKLDLSSVMNEGKIFLGRLSQGAIGEENAYLLGTFLVSKFHQAALSRQEIPEEKRLPFYLYIDEFHNFITPSMASILQGGRKFRLGLTLAHQELRQLSKNDSELASAVLANPHTRICFRVGDEDAKKLAEGFSYFETEDLQNLGVGEAICRVEKAEQDFNLTTFPVKKQEVPGQREKIRALSRERYATTKSQVETELALRYAVLPEPEEKIVEDKPIVRTVSVPEKQVDQTEARAKPRPATRISTAKETTAGRGGQQHKYLQSLIKKYAEDKGYRATIERSVLEGKGSIDVALEREGRSIACEVSVTTDAEQELGNLGKCLSAGFELVILVSPNRKILNQVKELAESSLKEEMTKLRFFTPEEVFAFLEAEEAAGAGKVTVVRGYKVKTNFRAVSDSEKEEKKQGIAQTILNALKRLKGE